ncbi:hypothetical protein TVAG_303920 [Trichomonas vaginalis G3]|uniref:DUF3447 domain-containing protein n=1 Tax=Trichomonas vaginalis (strain ATCC PRA-98 / G3) TaxID=412133 RepID=A2DR73_TRIV3|nr:spectrin binding [Trichomonas vaginalis G3]EAY17172.1 hypothetical protein TVAG_303920 [Trichomonas vaginalis G3]KAI5508903.1 spectrin binding [Trichomonas vaginalis G3]|eukprot:XP_001329395.1 hypothetical protein [Trichomonas vaginalis G3]
MSNWAPGYVNYTKGKRLTFTRSLPDNLSVSTINNIDLPQELQVYAKIEDLLKNLSIENLEATINSLSQIMKEDETTISVVFNYVSYFKNLFMDDRYEQLIKILSKDYNIKFDNVYNTLYELNNLDRTLLRDLPNDNIQQLQNIIKRDTYSIISYDTKGRLIKLCLVLGFTNCVQYMILNGFDINSTHAPYAVFGGNLELIENLEANKIKFDNCLEYSIATHHNDISDYLLMKYKCEEIDANLCLQYFNIKAFYFCLQNGLTKTPFYENAVDYGYFGLLRYLVNNGMTHYVDRAKVLKYYISKDFFIENKFILENFKDNSDAESNAKIFRKIVNTNSVKLVKLFISNGYDPNVNLKIGNLANFAAKKGNVEFMKLLISKGVNINLTGQEMPETPLSCAVMLHNYEMVELLIQNGADPNIFVEHFPLKTAIYGYDDENALMIMNSPKFVYNDIYDELLFFVLQKNNLIFATKFIQNVEKGKFLTKEYLLETAKNETFYLFNMLLENINFIDYDLFCVLTFCSGRGLFEFVKSLIEKRNAPIDYGEDVIEINETPLYSAIRNNFNEIAKYLIEKGAKINGYNRNLDPMVAAVINNNFEIVELLVNAGSTMRHFNWDGPLYIMTSDRIKELLKTNPQ